MLEPLACRTLGPMHLLLITTIFLWGGGMLFALFMASRLVTERDEMGRPRLLSQFLVRGGACLAAGVGLASLSVAASIVGHIVEVWRYMPLAWLACCVPLLFPTGRLPLLSIRVSHVALVGASFGLTMAFGFSLALYVLITLLRTQPILG
ncbi:MAG: hypothetical protein FJ315_07625 [SAR202 cluster bacterium]|nr:hypothetical protein [SAR202 cluster bacterium]